MTCIDTEPLGSSPLTRGAPEEQIRAGWASGLIPAHAGSTTTTGRRRASERAHPRSRGEHNHYTAPEGRKEGSSPLTRGAHPVTIPAGGSGLIPAHAGSTEQGNCVGVRHRAHPRSRGEHSDRLTVRGTLSGSSPLTRGALGMAVPVFVWRGLIPAHAGSTFLPALLGPAGWAHPRSRGEHWLRPLFKVWEEGSSPLTRGALVVNDLRGTVIGLIPAHAGSTDDVYSRASPDRAHPRSRGEHSFNGEGGTYVRGSSPLTRGARSE